MSISSGSGKVDYALVIAGVPDIWVTTTRLEQTLADGRQIRAGLQYQGLRIREEAHLRDAELDVAGITFRIVHAQALAAFAKRPTEVGELRANWKSGNQFEASESTNFSAGDLAHLNTAVYEVSSVSAASSGTVTVTITTDVEEPLRDTLAQYHYRTVGARAANAPIYDAPGSLEGRRVYLYRFDATETWSDATSVYPYQATDKTPIWRGVIRQAPRLDSDGVTWMVETDSIVALLNQSVAGVDAPGQIRGAYYHIGCPFVLKVFTWTTASGGSDPEEVATRWVTGFFETDADFRDAVNDECDDIASVLSGVESLKIEEAGETYRFVAWTPSSDPRFITMLSGSFIDGMTDPTPTDGNGNNVQNVTADSQYSWTLQSIGGDAGHALGMPRVLLTSQGIPSDLGQKKSQILRFAFDAPTNLYDTTTDTDQIIHLDREPPTDDVTEIGTIVVKDAVVQPQEEYNILNATISQANRTINFGSDEQWEPLLLDRNARIVFARGISTTEGLKAYRQHLIDNSVHANFGDTPFITARDLSTWDVWDEAAEEDVQANRVYVFEEAVDLYDMLRGEALLLGCFWRLDAEGKIELARMRTPDVSGAGLTSIDTTNTVSPYDSAGAWPTWEPGGDGIANEVTVTLPLQSERATPGDPRTFNIRLVEAIGLRKSRGRGNAEIEVMSSSVARNTEADEVAKAISDYIGLMSTDYQRVTIPVTFDLFSVKVGDYVLVSNPHIPNVETGERGITNKQGLVVARDWPLDPGDRAYGELTVVLFDTQLTGGYAPSFYYDTATDQGGGVWRFTPGQTTPPAMWSDLWDDSKVDVTDLFVVGDTVVVRPLAASGTVLEGTINAVTATGSGSTGEIDVDLGGSTPASEGLIDFVTGDTPSDVSDDQGAYAYVADSGGSLYSGRVYWKFA